MLRAGSVRDIQKISLSNKNRISRCVRNDKNQEFIMTQIAFIAVGGAIGALMRFWMSSGVYAMLGRDFPYGTLSVNVLGSIIMGVLYVFLYERMNLSAELRAGLVIGLLGAFTTFSTFSIETLNLLEAGEQLRAMLNILLSVALCISACWFGIISARQL